MNIYAYEKKYTATKIFTYVAQVKRYLDTYNIEPQILSNKQ